MGPFRRVLGPWAVEAPPRGGWAVLQPVAQKLFRKSNPWPLDDGGAAFDLAVACCLANVSCWQHFSDSSVFNFGTLSAVRGRAKADIAAETNLEAAPPLLLISVDSTVGESL